MSMKFDVDSLSVTSGGAGAPALFIHGFGFSKFTWRYVCQSLADRFTYYAIDLPGSGSSPIPDDFDCTLESFADVVARLIIRKNLQNLTLVGWSLGGGIALLALLRHRQELSGRIKALCIIAGIAFPQRFPFFVGLLRIPILGGALINLCPAQMQARAVLRYCYFDAAVMTDEQVVEYASHLRKPWVGRALVKTARSIDSERLAEYIAKLNSIDLRSLLIWGARIAQCPCK